VSLVVDPLSKSPLTKLDVDASSYWGPCYDEPNTDLLATQELVSVIEDAPNRRKDRGEANTYFHRDPNYPTMMRDQTFWKTPSIFANPFKPMIPINAPPVEPLLQVGKSIPRVTLGIRTPTELAQLENEVHKLRNLLLGRVRDCPYADCRRTFKYGDEDALDSHVREEHPVLRCPYCYVAGLGGIEAESNLYFADKDRALEHFYKYHWDHVTAQAGIGPNHLGFTKTDIPDAVSSNKHSQHLLADYKHCHQCGRDNVACHDRQDRRNHEQKCNNMDNIDSEQQFLATGGPPSKPKYCTSCGVESQDQCQNTSCAGKAEGTHNPPKICCIHCGLPWAGYSALYQAIHKAGCRPLGGRTWDFCGFCGISFAAMDDLSKHTHAEFCNERPKPQPTPCPECSHELQSPSEAKEHFEKKHDLREGCLWCDQKFPAHRHDWNDEVKIQHFAGHMGAHPQTSGMGPGNKTGFDALKCPGFVDCGSIVSHMTTEQYNNHMRESHSIAMTTGKTHHPNGQRVQPGKANTSASRSWNTKSTATTEEPEQIEAGMALSRERFQWDFPTQPRAASPDWDANDSYSSSVKGNFQPAEAMRCSRCFMPAPGIHDSNRENEIAVRTPSPIEALQAGLYTLTRANVIDSIEAVG
jgi:hypothetical protein